MFNSINHLLFKKTKHELDAELLDSFSPYMVTRYLSFHNDGAFAIYCNETLNTYSGLFEGEDLFRFYDNVIPKTKYRRLQYVKKPKKAQETESDKQIPDFYSKREIALLTIDE